MKKLINILLILLLEVNYFVNSEFTYNRTSSTLDDQYSRNALLLPGKSHPDVDLDDSSFIQKWIINPKNYNNKHQNDDETIQMKNNNFNIIDDLLKKRKLAHEVTKKNSNSSKSKSNSVPELQIRYDDDNKLVINDMRKKLINNKGRLSINVRKVRQLSSRPINSQEIIKNEDDIEFKELTSHLIPIIILDYPASNEESYEEMDELLKIKKNEEENDKSLLIKKYKRGDMDPMVSSALMINNDYPKDNHKPERGDLVSVRNKRSYYYDEYDQNNELWGFGEDDGIELNDYDNYNDYHNNDNYEEFKINLKNQSKPFNQQDESNTNDYNKMRIKKLIEERDRENRNKNSNKFSTLNQDNLMEQKQKKLSVIDLEDARLNSLPVLAKIIIQSDLSTPSFKPRNNFDDDDIGFPGINPNYKGFQVSNFPAASTTSRPLTKPPHPCVWAIVQCCTSNNNIDNLQLFKCFEFMNCPGVINWDPDSCRSEIIEAAITEVKRYYSTSH